MGWIRRATIRKAKKSMKKYNRAMGVDDSFFTQPAPSCSGTCPRCCYRGK